MKIGLTFNVRSGAGSGEGAVDPHWPDDAEEEFDSPETIEALAAAIRELGHEVELLGDGEPMLRRLLHRASGEARRGRHASGDRRRPGRLERPRLSRSDQGSRCVRHLHDDLRYRVLVQ